MAKSKSSPDVITHSLQLICYSCCVSVVRNMWCDKHVPTFMRHFFFASTSG